MKDHVKLVVASTSAFVEKIIDDIVAIMFSVLIISCVTQVFMRSILNDSPPWTEELARYSFMYVNIIGAAICVRNKSHVRVTAILEILGHTARQVLEIVSDLFILFVSYILIHYGIICVIQVVAQRSPAMRVCMSFVYACIPLAGLLIAYEALISLYRNIRNFKKKEAEQ